MENYPRFGIERLGAVKYQSTSQEHNIKDESNQAEAYRAGLNDKTIMDRNPFLYTDPDNPYALPISILPEGGIYQRRDYKMLGYDFRATLSWNKVFKEDHITNFFAGTEINSPTVTEATHKDGVCNMVWARFLTMYTNTLRKESRTATVTIH